MVPALLENQNHDSMTLKESQLYDGITLSPSAYLPHVQGPARSSALPNIADPTRSDAPPTLSRRDTCLPTTLLGGAPRGGHSTPRM